jgi:atypical dual specificity phosphatase
MMPTRTLLFHLASTTVLPAVACVAGDNGESAPMQDGFSWVIQDQLAGMPQPGSLASLVEDAEFLAQQGIDLLISLTGGIPNPDTLGEFGIESLHLPVEDFHPPTLDQQIEFVQRTSQRLAAGGRVGVHCAAGIGRTGTMLATYFVYLGSSPEEAIAQVRDLRPGSIETEAQEEAIRRYHQHIREQITD